MIYYVAQQVVTAFEMYFQGFMSVHHFFSLLNKKCILHLLSICSWSYGFQIQIPRPHDCLLWPISLCVSRKAGHRSLQPGSVFVWEGKTEIVFQDSMLSFQSSDGGYDEEGRLYFFSHPSTLTAAANTRNMVRPPDKN